MAFGMMKRPGRSAVWHGAGLRSALWLGAMLMSAAAFWLASSPTTACAAEPSYVRDVQPLMRKYCGGCHNEADQSADFSVTSYENLLKGTPDAKVIVAGDAASSRLLQLMKGEDEPRMPPEKEAQPTAAEIAKIEAWIAAGAKNDASSVPLGEQLAAPMLAADPRAADYVTALIDVSDKLVAVARYGAVELRDRATDEVVHRIGDLPGKINQLRLSPDRKFLLVASGIAGVGGQVSVVDVEGRKVVGQVQGHRDTIYCAAMSPDARWLATGSYDRNALLWDWREQKIVRRFTGHNGAIYDLDIDPEGKVLATASADQTVKLWGLGDGTRLDTLGQPEGEMLCVRFTPDGRRVVASGADRQLRLWQLVSKDRPAINPLRVSRFAHEEPVTQIVFRGQDQLISLSEDRTVKLWELDQLRPLGLVTQCGDVPTGVGMVSADSSELLIVDYSGKRKVVELPAPHKPAADEPTVSPSEALSAFKVRPDDMPPMPEAASAEAEPNNEAEQANAVTLPAKIRGVIGQPHNGQPDADLFAFDAKAGVPWVIEVDAARSKSPLDSTVDILDEQGNVVLRTRLQAV
ncbi:MAG: WD40 repeat domain-containing protein [Aureliella sp.]